MIIAHRGASHEAPENTLAAFNLAWRQGADAIECDVWMTRDARIVCIHDRTTKRTGRKNLDVTRSTLAQLRQLDVGSWKGPEWKGQRIPTLEEVLSGVPDGRSVFVEVKGGPEVVHLLPGVIERVDFDPNQLAILSFDPEVVRKSKETLPKTRAFLLMDLESDPVESKWPNSATCILSKQKRTKADGVDVSAAEIVNEHFVKRMHDAGCEVHVWTVNDLTQATRYWGFGVDSITTDKPKVIKDLIDKLEGKKRHRATTFDI